MIPCSAPLEQYRAHKVAIDTAISRVLNDGGYILGRELADFESAFARHCSSAHAVGVANGTDALVLALRAMNIGPGDEVITVSHTALATVAAVLSSGATPSLVDIDPVYYTIDPALIEKAITRKTRAIIAVHLYGQAADIAAIQAIARRHKLRLIEDCAQSTGGFYRGRRLGSMGDAGTFSFYPTKNLGAIGDGGMVVTGSAKLAERIARLRQYGWNGARQTKEAGYNSRLDPLQAAILAVKLFTLDADNARRAAIAARYTSALSDLDIVLPVVRDDSQHVFHLYVLLLKRRDAVKRALAAHGIEAGLHYPVPAHRHKGYADKVRIPKTGLPVTDRLAHTVLSLPMYPELSDAEVDKVIAVLRNVLGGR
jgi:dTDP-4-amino-4,6-dideoxygalactose transaminase